MLNKNPIFIVAFSRGGSNILLNILRSHPMVCSPRGETQEVFKGKGSAEPALVRVGKAIRYLPIRILQNDDIFSSALWSTREKSSGIVKFLIDRVLYHDKLQARAPSQNYYRTEGIPYTQQEIRDSRLLCKNLDGLIFLSEMFYDMYPDATFIALVRNGLAVCEGHIRRGIDAAAIAAHYEKGCQQMLTDRDRIPHYHIIKYEDIVADPLEALKKIYAYAGLDHGQVDKIRLETKAVLQPDGRHAYIHGTQEKTLLWYDISEFHRHLADDANANQIGRLSDAEKNIIREHAGNSLRYFDYL